MRYEKQTWTDGQTVVYAATMQHIEQGIADAVDAINNLDADGGGGSKRTPGVCICGGPVGF